MLTTSICSSQTVDRYVPILKQYKSSPDTKNFMVQLAERLARKPAMLEVGDSISARDDYFFDFAIWLLLLQKIASNIWTNRCSFSLDDEHGFRSPSYFSNRHNGVVIRINYNSYCFSSFIRRLCHQWQWTRHSCAARLPRWHPWELTGITLGTVISFGTLPN